MLLVLLPIFALLLSAPAFAAGAQASAADLTASLHESGTLALQAQMGAAEKLADFLTGPVVRTLLFAIGFAGVAIAMIVPGLGVPGIAGIAAFALYFYGNFVTGSAGVEDILLFVIGIVLLASELFVPSFGILAALGTTSLIAGAALAAQDPKEAILSLVIAAIAAGIVVYFVARRFRHRGVWNKFILRDRLTTEEGYVSTADKKSLLGAHGAAITPLRPAGTANIGGRRIDVVTSGEFIASGTDIEVIEVEGMRVVVQRREENQHS